MEQRSEEWFEARKGLVTGSSVGAILGLDPNRTKADVLRAMVRDGTPANLGDARKSYDEARAKRFDRMATAYRGEKQA